MKIKEFILTILLIVAVILGLKLLLFLGYTYLWDDIKDADAIVNGIGFIIIGIFVGESILNIKKNYLRAFALIYTFAGIFLCYSFSYFTSYLSLMHEVKTEMNISRTETRIIADNYYKQNTGYTGFIGYMKFELNRTIDREILKAGLAESSMEDSDLVMIEKLGYWIVVEVAYLLGVTCTGYFTFYFWLFIGLLFVAGGFISEYDSAAGFPAILAANKKNGKVRITGTSIYLKLPRSFKPLLNGALYEKEGAKIFGSARRQNFAGYSKNLINGLQTNKVTKDYLKHLQIKGMDGLMIEASGKKSRSLFLTFGNNEITYSLHAVCRTKKMRGKIRRIFKNFYFDDKAGINDNEIVMVNKLVNGNFSNIMKI